MLRLRLAHLSTAAISMCALSCSEDSGPPHGESFAEPASESDSSIRELRSSLDRVQGDGAMEGAAAQAVNEFAWELYLGSAGSLEENYISSPLSLSIALATLSTAAAGSSLAQLTETLAPSVPEERFHEGYGTLISSVAELNRTGGNSSNPQIVRISNDVWIASDLRPTETMLDTLAMFYGAGVQLAEFASSPDSVREAINGKVSRDTERLITDLLPPGSIGAETRSVITSALYLSSRWKNPFPVSQTEAKPFKPAAGTDEVQVEMMRNPSVQLPYARSGGYEAFALPYDNLDFEMVVVVPDDFEAFSRDASSADLASVPEQLELTLLDVSLPRFSVSRELNLRGELERLGIVDIFDPDRADLRHLGPGTYANDVFHWVQILNLMLPGHRVTRGLAEHSV